MEKRKRQQFDVVIVGAGVIGCGIARELSRYRVKVAVMEKKPDVGWGTSKANSGIIHAGYASSPGTLKARFAAPGNKIYERWTEPLSVPFQRPGSFVCCKDQSRVEELFELKEQGEENGVEGLEVIRDREAIFEMEPNLASDVVAVLHAPTAGVVASYKLTVALFENARENGVQFFFDAPLEEIDRSGEGERNFRLSSADLELECDFLVNAAGLNSGKISALAGGPDFGITPARGEYHLLDSELADCVNKINFPLPTPQSKGILVTPAAEGSIIMGPNHESLESPSKATTLEGLNEVLQGGKKLFPDLDTTRIITNFAGLRAKADCGDFVIGPVDEVPGLINVGGIQSPGLTGAPAISDHVVDSLEEEGLKMERDEEFVPVREPIPDFEAMDKEEKERYMEEDPRAKEIVCRCEKITRAEIEEAIERGAHTLDGIKFRTRAGMGNCQGGFCTLKLVPILAEKLGVAPSEVTKRGKSSTVLDGMTDKGEGG